MLTVRRDSDAPSREERDGYTVVRFDPTTSLLGNEISIGLAREKDSGYLLASTSEVYGDPDVNPQPEEYRGRVDPYGPRSCYDESKRYGESLVRAYHEKHDIDVRVARIFNTYGPALPLCDRWEMSAEILVDETAGETRQFMLNHTEDLDSHYSAGDRFDSDLERTLAKKWERANTEWELVREDDIFDLGAEVMIPDFTIEHPDGRRAILEIVGFWTPEYLNAKLEKIRQVEADNFVLAVSERLDCASEEFGSVADRVLWFKTGIHVYDVIELVDKYATRMSQSQEQT